MYCTIMSNFVFVLILCFTLSSNFLLVLDNVYYFNEVKSEFLSVAVVSTFNILAIYSTIYIYICINCTAYGTGTLCVTLNWTTSSFRDSFPVLYTRCAEDLMKMWRDSRPAFRRSPAYRALMHALFNRAEEKNMVPHFHVNEITVNPINGCDLNTDVH